MQEKYVTFETAKLAKRKGFNEFCRKIFNTEGKSSNITGYMQMKGWNINDKVHLYDTNSEEFEEPDVLCTQPSQTLLQKWLREKHKKEIVIYPSSDHKPVYYYAFKMLTDMELIRKFQQPVKWFKNYEDALENALFVHLKSLPDDNS